ncbi:MAG: sigma-70 family RNA polymerase sigma factor [Oscillospiraceae bacterium]|nr:sigma-70 family RNA polymerase sigma factor [Oscillospiraceae bacterium]
MVEDFTRCSVEELLARCGESHEAMRELITRHTRLVRACARPFFLAGGDDEDLLQEGMLGLLDAIRAYQPDSGVPFEAFAALCVRRSLISAVRAATARKHAPLNEALPLDRAELQLADPEAALLDREGFRTMLETLRGRLSPLERGILPLYLDGFSCREIAAKTGKTPKSVDNALQRIRRKAVILFGEDGSSV